MNIKNANSHPFQVEIVGADENDFYANSHPYKVAVVGGHIGIEGRVVEELPQEGETGYIYLVLKETTSEGDIYDEYMWTLQQDGETYAWEHIGATNEVTIKLYDTTGQNTDGAMTQKAVTDALEDIESITELTTADYNWPTANPNGFALWKMEPGIYTLDKDATTEMRPNYYVGSDNFANTVDGVSWTSYQGFMLTTYRNGSSVGNVATFFSPEGTASFVTYSYHPTVHKAPVVVTNNLISTSTTAALSANQGKVLNDKIGGDLSNLTTTDKTSLINAINEVAGQGGGGIIELTSADYNWPTANPTSVALWLLEPGLYVSGQSYLNFQPYAGNNDGLYEGEILIVSKGAINSYYTIGMWASLSSSGEWNVAKARTSDGSVVLPTSMLPIGVVDNLASTSNTSALSANQGKILKDLIDSIAIRGAGAPTTSTVGEVGQLYEDGTNGALYQLKSIDITVTPNTYNWEQVGGSSVNVVQTTGTSTTDVMSQNAVTSMVYADPATRNNVKVGRNTSATGYYSVAVGFQANAQGNNNVAIGRSANVDSLATNAVAIGEYSFASTKGQFDISALGNGSSATEGYNNSAYRLLTGLYDPQSNHDAATKGYVDTAVASVGVAEINATDWSTLWQ